jgi:hypothetical protein
MGLDVGVIDGVIGIIDEAGHLIVFAVLVKMGLVSLMVLYSLAHC